MSGFSGNSQGINDATGDALTDITWNFAVLDRSGGSDGDAFGTGVAGFDDLATPRGFAGRDFDSSALYLYLYQDVNDGNAPGALGMVDCQAGRCFDALITSFATWELSFTDGNDVVGVGVPFGSAANQCSTIPWE